MTQIEKTKIHLLPEHIIDQIKAGEVIERPSTLIKELLENSLDAQATKIDIHLIENGMDLIQVEDNGIGMSYDDLPMAFCRHATSKLDKFEQLYGLSTYGFRGEALASIASVSRITCRSHKEGHAPSSLKIEGAQIIAHNKEETQSQNYGTKLYIKDLFFNTPVRFKFLQSKTTEKNHLNKIIRAFILSHPEIDFSVKWDDKKREVYPAVTNENMNSRISRLFFKNENNDFHDFENSYDGITVRGYLSHYSNKGNAGKHHFIFVNGRYIQDITLHKIILHSISNLWNPFETGHYVLYIETPLDQVDINVHPNKTIVKFFQSSKVYSVLSNALKKYASQNAAAPQLEHSIYERPHEQLGFEPTQQTWQDKKLTYSETSFEPSGYEYTEQALLEEHSVVHNFETMTLIRVSQTQELYVVDNQVLVVESLLARLQNNIDDSTTPLLISMPIQYSPQPVQWLCDELNKVNIEVDILSEKTLALRSLPSKLTSFPIARLIEEVLKTQISSYDQFIEKLRCISCYDAFTPRLIQEILSSMKVPQILNTKNTRLLSESILRKIIK